MKHRLLQPKILTVLEEGYSFKKFIPDLTAGIIVGIVALPLAIAFAIASGVKPEQGLYTAIVAGFIISALSGSRVQIGGPTGAFIVIVYGVVQQYGYEGLVLATLMAGVMLIVMGLARFGDVIKFIPYPVTVGFTAGIALIILSSQIRDFFGLSGGAMPAEFIEKLRYCGEYFDTVNFAALALGAGTLAMITLWPKAIKKIPAPFVAIVLATVIVRVFDLPVETIGSRFGAVPNTLPAPHWPQMSWAMLRQMSSPALTIAILAGIESLLSAVVADGMTGYRHRSNMELIAQGAANIASAVMGGIPATGAIARTATNIKSGGRTPFAGMIHAVTLLLILVAFGPLAAMIPMAALAGILVNVAYHMSEWKLFVRMLRSPKSDVLVLLATFLLTVFIDLTVAIEVGIVLAALLFMRRMAETTQVGYITDSLNEEINGDDLADRDHISRKNVPDGVEVFEINGPFFFGAADKFKDTIRSMEKKPRVLILRMRHVFAVDATALSALENVLRMGRKDGTQIILSGLQPEPLKRLRDAGVLEQIETQNVQPNIDEALQRASAILAGE